MAALFIKVNSILDYSELGDLLNYLGSFLKLSGSGDSLLHFSKYIKFNVTLQISLYLTLNISIILPPSVTGISGFRFNMNPKG